MAHYEWQGGDRVITFDDEPQPVERWVVRWDLDAVQVKLRGVDEHFDSVLDAPDVNAFRLEFATEAEALHFKAELQRYRSHVLAHLSTELQALFNGR
jgi:hypothetical protein